MSMNEPSQVAFVFLCRDATERLWKHRTALQRVAVRIGFWPDGLVISAKINARDQDELKKLSEARVPRRVVPWDELAIISPERLVAIVDELCRPLYAQLGLTPDEVP